MARLLDHEHSQAFFATLASSFKVVKLLRAPDPVPQVEDCDAQAVCDDVHRVQCRVGVAVLKPTKIGLVEAASLTKLDLREAGFQAQFANTASKALGEWLLLHIADYLRYASIHINTNSYIGRRCGWQRRSIKKDAR